MIRRSLICGSLACAMALPPAGLGAQEAALDPAALVETRRAEMKQMSDHFAVIGNMMRGRAEYDPAAATEAARGLLAIAEADWAPLFVEGTAYGEIDKSEAHADIWRDWDKFLSLQADLVPAVQGLADAAGQGMDALRPAVMGTAKVCGACHTPFRVSN